MRDSTGWRTLTEAELRHDPFSGVVLVFRAKRADRIRILVWDGSGIVLIAKRLEGGKCASPAVLDGVMRLSRRDPGTVPGARHPPIEIRLPSLHRGRRAGAGAGPG